MTDNCFVDTNILVYARDAGAGRKQAMASELLNGLWKSRRGRISVQVLNEYYVSVTRKLKPGLSKEAAWGDVTLLNAWEPMAVSWDVMELARTIQKKHNVSWRDSLIVASARLSGCRVLYSEDLTHGVRYGDVTVTNPFVGK